MKNLRFMGRRIERHRSF